MPQPRWKLGQNTFEQYSKMQNGGNSTPYFSIIYDRGYLNKNRCHDIVSGSMIFTKEGSCFLIEGNKNITQHNFQSISNLFELLNTHYELEEDDKAFVYQTSSKKHLEVSVGGWWGQNRMRKYALLKLLRFAYNYNGEYNNDSEEGRLETIKDLTIHFAEEALYRSYDGTKIRYPENNDVYNHLEQVIENVTYLHKIPANWVHPTGLNNGFLNTLCIKEINNYVKVKILC